MCMNLFKSQNKMEWRVFFPTFIQSEQLQWNRNTNDEIQSFFQQLELAQRCMTTMIFDTPSSPLENRKDTYFIGAHYLGLKYRNQNKLELKISVELDRSTGVECWSKSKYSKDGIYEDKEKIFKKLNRAGYMDNEFHESILKAQRVIGVSKSRKNTNKSGISQEYCMLSVDPAPDVVHSHWASVCFEGYSMEDMKNYLSNSPVFREFFQYIFNASKILQDLAHTYPEVKALQPLICGYPFWIQFVCSAFNEDVLQSTLGIFSSLESLLNPPATA